MGTLCGALGLIGSISAMQNGKKGAGTEKEQVMKPMKASQMFGAEPSPIRRVRGTYVMSAKTVSLDVQPGSKGMVLCSSIQIQT